METIRCAKVIDNSYSSQSGKIQVRILPEMNDVDESLLPWIGIYNQGEGTSSTIGVHDLPEIGTFIRVVIEDWPFMKKVRYLSNDYVEGLYIYTKSSGLSAISELGTQTYPQPIFKIFKDGSIDFHNSTTGEHGTLYKNGQYTIVDSSGNIFCNAKDKEVKIYNTSGYFKLTATGDIELNGNLKNLVTHAELNAALQTFVTALNLHTHTFAGTIIVPALTCSGSTLVPTSPMSLDIATAKANTVKTS